jgi:ATP-dependent Clp endopeptidase proteolytic subunit ClpP
MIKNKKKWYNMDAATGDIYIYDAIDPYIYSSKDFIEDLKKIKSDTLTLHINSPGGSVFEGLAIYNTIKKAEKNVTVEIEGLCASIASIIACSGDKVKMHAQSLMMIHKPEVATAGNSNTLQEDIDILNKMEDKLIDVYVLRTGKPAEEIKQLMDKVTWFTAEEALAFNLIDEIIEGKEMKMTAMANIKTIKNSAELMEKWQEFNNKTEGDEAMEEILTLLGVETEEEAIAKIAELLGKEETEENKEEELTNLKNSLNKYKVQVDIANGKILPAEEAFAIKLLNKDESLYSDFVKAERITAPTSELKLPVNRVAISEIKSFLQLLEDTELAEQVRKGNPDLYNALYDNYVNKGV